MLALASITVSGFLSFNSTNVTSYVQDVVYQNDVTLSDYTEAHLKLRVRYFGPAYGTSAFIYSLSEDLMLQLREAYLLVRPFSSGSLEVYLGKKRSSFGFADAFSPQDVVDPFEIVVPTDMNERTPSIVSQLSLYPSLLYSGITGSSVPVDSEVDFLVRFFNKPSIMGFLGGEMPFTSLPTPELNATNAFYLARLRLTYDVVDFSLGYFRGINSFPVLNSTTILNGVPIFLEGVYPWLSGITAGLSWSLWGANFYLEGSYNLYDIENIPVEIIQNIPSPPFVLNFKENLTLENAIKVSAGVDFGIKGFEFIVNSGYGLPWEYRITTDNGTCKSFESHQSYYLLGKLTRKLFSDKVELGVSGMAFLAENATDNLIDNLNYMTMFCASYLPDSPTTFKVMTSLSGGEEPFASLSDRFRVMLYFETSF